MNINELYLKEFAQNLLNIDSPSGFTHQAIEFLKAEAHALGYKTSVNQKGNLVILVEGNCRSYAKSVITHVDTLGLMVRSISSDGLLNLTNIGGPIIPTLDSEYVKIYTRDKRVYTGTIVSKAPAVHVHPNASKLERTIENMVVQLDERVASQADVLALGIQNGDFVCIDTKTVWVNDFIKSRFLDDKISVACMFTALKALKDNNVQLENDTFFIVSTYEEVGHGAAHLPARIREVLAVDMGCIGLDLAGNEFSVSICTKDSSGPYDYEFTNDLIGLAKVNRVKYVLDIFPYYGSDASSALRAGNNIKAALIGPGVFASHGLERTHLEALTGTTQLILAYLTTQSKKEIENEQ